jgi:flavin-dependent dehydrogenase
MKVSVIGASIPGLFAAYLLAKEGVEVEVYDRADAHRLLPRTLIVTNRLYDVLDFIPEEAIVNKVKYLELFSRSKSARLELSQPDLVVEREKFLKLLTRLAQEEGTKIIFRHRFVGFARSGRKIVVTLEDLETGEEQHVITDILVGADGALSAVSRAVSCNGHYLMALFQARVSLTKNLSPDTCQVWFDSNQTRYFYWLIPESDQVAAIGLIADDAHRAEDGLMSFLQERRLEPLEFQSAMVPMHRFMDAEGIPTPEGNVFTVGDAAAQVKATTVGGVLTGLHGTKALTHAILNGRSYHKELRGLRLELHLHLLIRHVLNRFKEEDYDELISMLDGGLKGILEERTRDELTHSFLRLIWNEPRLVTLGAKSLLRSMLWGSD